MSRLNRRRFLQEGAAALAVGALGRASRLGAAPLSLPIGLELYTVRQQFMSDAKGTLAQVAAIGYQEVELFSFAKHTPTELKQMVEVAGLKAPAAHCRAEDLQKDTAPLIDSFREAGLTYMICSFPGHRPGTAHTTLQIAGQGFNPHFSQDDYQWMAEAFNQVGASCQKAGLQFGYHNHNLDFMPLESGQLALDYLLQQTDPKLVQLEMDCYWVARAGKDPIEYMKRYPGRIPILHLKDMKGGVTPTTDITKGGDAFAEVGRGTLDWKRIFQAAPEAGVKHGFVEQDKCDGPPMESAKISYQYLKALQV